MSWAFLAASSAFCEWSSPSVMTTSALPTSRSENSDAPYVMASPRSVPWTVSMLGLTASSCMRAALKSPVSGSCGTACPAKTPKLTLLPSRRSSILEMRRRARSRRLGDASRASIELDTSSMKHTSIPPFPCVTVFSPYCGRATITIKAARAPITSENFSPRRMRERRGAIWSSRSASARRTLRERAW